MSVIPNLFLEDGQSMGREGWDRRRSSGELAGGLAPNRQLTGSAPQPGVWGPLLYVNKGSFKMFNSESIINMKTDQSCVTSQYQK